VLAKDCGCRLILKRRTVRYAGFIPIAHNAIAECGRASVFAGASFVGAAHRVPSLLNPNHEISRAMPRLNGLLETSLYVDDLARSLAFYRRVFGFEPIFSNERLIALGVEERQILLLFKKKLSALLPQGPHDGDGRLHLAFAIDTSELSAWESWLADNGIAVEERKEWERGGVSLYFRDPDDHLLELATPGVWTIY
jgi:catechol 2,3-dioxygenase-like lactoylglutathione lyase family enzyme